MWVTKKWSRIIDELKDKEEKMKDMTTRKSQNLCSSAKTKDSWLQRKLDKVEKDKNKHKINYTKLQRNSKEFL